MSVYAMRSDVTVTMKLTQPGGEPVVLTDEQLEELKQFPDAVLLCHDGEHPSDEIALRFRDIGQAAKNLGTLESLLNSRLNRPRPAGRTGDEKGITNSDCNLHVPSSGRMNRHPRPPVEPEPEPIELKQWQVHDLDGVELGYVWAPGENAAVMVGNGKWPTRSIGSVVERKEVAHA